MNEEHNTTCPMARREFLFKSIPACAFACLGFSQLSAAASKNESDHQEIYDHKFDKKLDWTYEQVYRWRNKLFVDRINRISSYLGRDKVIEALKKSTEDYYSSIATYKPENTLQNFIKPFFTDEAFKTILTIEVIDNQEDFVKWRITECLNAKVFRELNAADIGYATLCHGDEAWARAYNPKIKFVRTKTLMEGDDCCDHCYIMEN
jgi:hypothetical protein